MEGEGAAASHSVRSAANRTTPHNTQGLRIVQHQQAPVSPDGFQVLAQRSGHSAGRAEAISDDYGTAASARQLRGQRARIVVGEPSDFGALCRGGRQAHAAYLVDSAVGAKSGALLSQHFTEIPEQVQGGGRQYSGLASHQGRQAPAEFF